MVRFLPTSSATWLAASCAPFRVVSLPLFERVGGGDEGVVVDGLAAVGFALGVLHAELDADAALLPDADGDANAGAGGVEATSATCSKIR